MKILMVCLGNICRSPLAEGIMKEKLRQRGLDWTVDSAGTGNWHIGEKPDPRSIAVARKHGIDISKQRARQFRASDLDNFDLILAMDRSNFRNIKSLKTQEDHAANVHMIMDLAHPGNATDVPDPYWNDDGFEQVFQMLDRACGEIINRLEEEKVNSSGN